MEIEKPIRILHLEDSPADAQLIQAMLKKSKVEFEYFFADNENDFNSILENQQIDIILSDYNLPDYSGTEALLLAKNRYPLIPFVFVSGTMGEDVAIESLLNGATDYVLKNRMERLGSAVNRAFKEAKAQKARLVAEKALLQSEENFHRSLSESPLGIRIDTVDGKTIFANKAFLDIYEFCSLEEFNVTPAKERYSTQSYAEHILRKEKRKNGEEISDYELCIVRKNGENRFIKVSRKEIIWDGVNHYQVINQDITDQKKLTSDLIAAKEKAEESDRLKTAFLHNISHEIRTPMNAIVGFSDFLNDPDLLPEHRKQYIDIIVMSSNHLLSIITDIISIATIEAGQEKIYETETNLNSTLEQIQKQFLLRAEKQNIVLNMYHTLPDTDFKILTDETKLVHVITNLIGNALKFTHKGHVNFGCNVVETMQTSSLQFFVEDTGIGIPSEMQGEIFKRFRQVENATTRNFGGSGLGLAITKAYVELLGGKIWVESEEGKGSKFYFTLPYNS